MALFVIDFDKTMVNGHTHYVITMAITRRAVQLRDEETQWREVKNFGAIGGAARWKAIFTSLLDGGHQVSIASFNSYGYIIPRFLREVVGLSQEQIDHIFVNSWLPDATIKSPDKNAHIEQIISHFYPDGSRPQRNQVTLVDDSEDNIVAAEVAGFSVIHAKPDRLFLDQLQTLANKPCVLRDVLRDGAKSAPPQDERLESPPQGKRFK